ncbi:DEAD/DEAH box helicase [Penaeicola halotolerans]|uniref:DEAD/DEAH box helicase n=1 Tax=Penaeicola halotolerans TaxID=2793196 RepID=UPI001CF8D57B|nr:DEAD/DEAH box helicase [Penaeicola halotolerans]
MNVSPNSPFQIIYSIFDHEFLGLLFESFVVQVDDKGRLTLMNQNISAKNAREFADGLDENDYKLIELMDSMQQDAVMKRFYNKKVRPREFFEKIYDEQKGNAEIKGLIETYLENKRAMILQLIAGKRLFEMGNDGNPAWREIQIMPKKATVLFHFRRNEDNTHYFPTLKYDDERLDWQYKGSYLICKEPAWMVIEGKLYSFEKEVDGKKLIPFLNKKFILIPRTVEETYYAKFVTQLVASFDVYAKGFDIQVERHNPQPILSFQDLPANSKSLSLFEENVSAEDTNDDQIVFDLSFNYGRFTFKESQKQAASVKLEKLEDNYVFYKIVRDQLKEKSYGDYLKEVGLPIKNTRLCWPKVKAFSWLNDHREALEKAGFRINQSTTDKGKKYFLGKSSIEIKISENIDWFDVHAIVKFGEFEIPFEKLRKQLVQNKQEVLLPNGEIAVIPEEWFTQYSEIFSFLENAPDSDKLILKKYHLALAQELKEGNLIELTLDRKLEKLRDFEQITDYDIPKGFKGTLRSYQKAGYNWLRFLKEYKFGGCLADDMGLGKTVQTLALLQSEKELNEHRQASLLVMPTSLIYNWELEARKFTPDLRILVYTGTHRIKDSKQFEKYDLVLTSYGIVRLDTELLSKFYFNYIILDESQAIKNPGSIISKSVNHLKSKFRLILTGTPVENTTLDLWSQMNFINPGLLGNQSFFKNQFLLPIEKKSDSEKAQKLHAIVKPFIMRRLKSQVATDLPEKVSLVKYSSMTPEQESAYEEVKSYYRNMILEGLEKEGMKGSQFMILRGLTQLRQIANHPKMTDPDYTGGSGKLEDITHMLGETISEGHKVLVFSQFVKHLAIVKAYLEEEKIPFAYLDGTTKDRQNQVEQFQNNEQVKVFLISLKAGGVGLNLTKAEYVFLLDPWWNPAVEAQAIDRAHRIGQENKVFIYKFITKDTVEEKIMSLQENKLRLANELVSTEEGFMKNLTQDDIKALLD